MHNVNELRVDFSNVFLIETAYWLKSSIDFPGQVFLTYNEETKKSQLPNEVTSMDTVKALFVRAFPKNLNMQWFDSPLKKIYILDRITSVYYEVDDLRWDGLVRSAPWWWWWWWWWWWLDVDDDDDVVMMMTTTWEDDDDDDMRWWWWWWHEMMAMVIMATMVIWNFADAATGVLEDQFSRSFHQCMLLLRIIKWFTSKIFSYFYFIKFIPSN